jgi:hypothetical protein
MRRALLTVFVSVGSVATGPLADAQTASDAPPPPSSTIAVVNVTVIPMDRERAIPEQTVLIRGDRIVAVGPTNEISAPEGAFVIDGNGRYLLPGLTDAHVHLSTNLPWAPARPDFGEGPLYLANGVTTVINLGGSPEQLDWRRRVETGELIGPTIYTSGEFVNEPRMKTAEQVEEAIRAQKSDGYDLVKFHERPNTTTGLTFAAYRRMIDVANEVQLPLVGHAPVNLGLDAMLDAHQSLAHVNMLSNIYFLPLASRTGTLFVSLGSFAGVLAAAMGLALCAWRYRRHEQQPFALRALRRTSLLAGAGISAAIILALVLPGGPASESVELRWLLTMTAVFMALGLLAILIDLRRTWSATTSAIRVLSVGAAGASAALAAALMLFWVPVAWRSSDAGLAAVAARLRGAGVTVQSTLVVYDSIGGPTRAEILSDPAISFLLPRTRELWAKLPTTGPPGYALPAFTRRLTEALHRAGVPIVAGTDAMGMEGIVPGFSMHRELQRLRAAGLTPYEAIFAATRAPSAFLQRSFEFGTIAAGQRADLLLINGNPLEDLKPLAMPEAVIVRGRWFSGETLQHALEALRRER